MEAEDGVEDNGDEGGDEGEVEAEAEAEVEAVVLEPDSAATATAGPARPKLGAVDEELATVLVVSGGRGTARKP